MVQMSKINLRKAYKKIRNNLSDNEVKTLSALINKTLLTQNEYRQASNIGSYYPINKEKIKTKMLGYFDVLGFDHESTILYRKKFSSIMFS